MPCSCSRFPSYSLASVHTHAHAHAHIDSDSSQMAAQASVPINAGVDDERAEAPLTPVACARYALRETRQN